MKTYSGLISKLNKNDFFVFGSNPQGRHGAGSANFALKNFGAIYGQGFGFQGNSYAIATKDLSKKVHPSISKNDIELQIKNLYLIAKYHPEYNFYIGYTGNGTNLNGYTNQEMANMFSCVEIPDNIIFEEEFAKLI